ncbi:hypothetical protein CC78DRAFT_555149 [Lojkania enalia]|uniref:Uncharacterized protein n=1 Tax=Lojkania enalia TaxID=147567 RepID=A0A9P4MXF8_9PLEO|nr:hypothetical protein CC78DRAFT_555149 [Didymosphaeria enalia]
MAVAMDSYTYIGIAEVTNEGLFRASWLVIGDLSSCIFRARIQLTHSLIRFQSLLSLTVSIANFVCISTFAEGFVLIEIRASSINYVRIAAFLAFNSVIEVTINASTRALDKPDVPLIINSTKFAIKIILDFVITSKFPVPSISPMVNMQAGIQLACNLASVTLSKFESRSESDEQQITPSLSTPKVLFKPSAITSAELVLRDTPYLYLVHNFVTKRNDYATTSTFNSHSWDKFREVLPVQNKNNANFDTAADITVRIWQTIGWCYILYNSSQHLAAILLATRPWWYLGQSFISNLFYILPWAVVCRVANLSAGDAWTCYSFVFGGGLVFSFFYILVADGLWTWYMKERKGHSHYQFTASNLPVSLYSEGGIFTY